MATVKVLYNQSIFDIANSNGYTIDYVMKLILENPFITSIDYDFNANPNQSVTYDETFKIQKPQILTQNASLQRSKIRTIKGLENQNLFDVATETTGIENIISLIQSNNVTNIDVTSLEGVLFNFNTDNIKDLGYYNNLNINKLRIVTGQNVTQFTQAINYLLQEDGTMLLQEDGTGIIIE